MKKQVSEAALAANRANGKKSKGPRTATGKLSSSRNAMTHGFFAQDLVLNDEEKTKFEKLRHALHAQLSPETAMQDVAFEEVMSCIGRRMLALRQEMRQVGKMLGENTAQRTQQEGPEVPIAATEWYLSGRQGLREGMRLLGAVKEDFLNLNRIDEKWNVFLDRAFGPQLRQLLTQWMPLRP